MAIYDRFLCRFYYLKLSWGVMNRFFLFDKNGVIIVQHLRHTCISWWLEVCIEVLTRLTPVSCSQFVIHVLLDLLKTMPSSHRCLSSFLLHNNVAVCEIYVFVESL